MFDRVDWPLITECRKRVQTRGLRRHRALLARRSSALESFITAIAVSAGVDAEAAAGRNGGVCCLVEAAVEEAGLVVAEALHAAATIVAHAGGAKSPEPGCRRSVASVTLEHRSRRASRALPHRSLFWLDIRGEKECTDRYELNYHAAVQLRTAVNEALRLHHGRSGNQGTSIDETPPQSPEDTPVPMLPHPETRSVKDACSDAVVLASDLREAFERLHRQPIGAVLMDLKALEPAVSRYVRVVVNAFAERLGMGAADLDIILRLHALVLVALRCGYSRLWDELLSPGTTAERNTIERTEDE